MNLYTMLSKIREKFEEIQEKPFKIFYKDGGDEVQISKNDDFEEAFAEVSDNRIIKFYVVLHPEGKLNFVDTSVAQIETPKLTPPPRLSVQVTTPPPQQLEVKPNNLI